MYIAEVWVNVCCWHVHCHFKIHRDDKAFPTQNKSGLELVKPSFSPSTNIDSVCKYECLQRIGQCVQKLSSVISSSWMFTYRLDVNIHPTETN